MEVFLLKILLLDNAIDSFEWSLRHLRTFLEMDSKFEHCDTSTTYLKQAILCLNSSLELFFKERISVINPYLFISISQQMTFRKSLWITIQKKKVAKLMNLYTIM